MKIETQINKLAKSCGIDTAYKLQKRAKLSPTNAARLYNDAVKQISLETLGKLCDVLACVPGDLFVVKKSKTGKE